MKRPYKNQIAEDQSNDSPSADQALAAIREQIQRLEPDEQRFFRRILRQAERLDSALADLHLFLPVIEICFYGVPSEDNTGHRLSARRLRELIQVWAATNRGVQPHK